MTHRQSSIVQMYLLARHLSRRRKPVPARIAASYAAELSRRLSRHILDNP